MKSKVRWNNILTSIDKKLGILGVLGSIFLLILSLIYFKSIQIQLISIFVMVNVLVYLLRRNQISSIEDLDFNTKFSKKSIILLINTLYVVVILITMVLWGMGYYSDPIIFLFIIVSLVGILTIEILYCENKDYNGFILAKLFIFGIFVRFYPYYYYPNQPGVDSIYHSNLILNIINSGHIPTIFRYESYPITHLIGVALSNVCNLSVTDSMFLISIISVIGLIFVYLICRKLFNEKIGLLSVLILICCASNITLGWWITAMTIGLIFIPMILYLMFPPKNDKNSFIYKSLLLLLIFVVIMVHPTPAVIVLVILGGSLLVDVGIIHWIKKHFKFENNSHILLKSTLSLTLLFLSLLFSYWIYKSGFILELTHIIKSAVTIDRSLAIDVSPGVQDNFIKPLFNALPLVLLMGFSLTGFLVNIRDLKKSEILHYTLLAALISFSIFCLYILKFYEALPGRWTPFIELIMAPLAVIGILIFTYSKIEKRRILYTSISLMIFAGLMVPIGISNVVAIIPDYDQPRLSFYNSESKSLESIYQISDEIDINKYKILTDSYAISWYMYRMNASKIRNAGPIYLNLNSLNGTLILRTEVLNNPILITSSLGASQFSMNESQYNSFVEGIGYNIFFDSGTVKGIMKG